MERHDAPPTVFTYVMTAVVRAKSRGGLQQQIPRPIERAQRANHTRKRKQAAKDGRQEEG